MSIRDLNALTDSWNRETTCIENAAYEAVKRAQDHAYRLGAASRVRATLDRISDEQIDAIAHGMPGGMDGFLKGWGWRQFARAIEDAHGVGAYLPEPPKETA